MTDERNWSWLDRWCVAGAVGGAWPRPVLRWMRSRIARSPHLRRAYDELSRAEHEASGSPVSRAQADSIEAALFGELDRARASSPSRGLKWGLPVLGATAAAAFFVVVSNSSPDDLSPRSGAGGAIGITVRCLEKTEAIRVVGEVSAGPGQPSRTLRCPSDGLLGFAFTNTTEQDVHAFVVGVTTDDDVRWYAPFTPESESVHVPPGSADELLSTVADLSPMNSNERIVLRAVFFSDRMQGSTLEAVIEQSKERRLSPSRLERLPMRDTVEARVELVVTSKENSGTQH